MIRADTLGGGAVPWGFARDPVTGSYAAMVTKEPFSQEPARESQQELVFLTSLESLLSVHPKIQSYRQYYRLK